MKIDIITLFPGMLRGFFAESIVKRAQDKGLLEIDLHDLRDYALNKYRSVDDYAFGGGAGMVMQIEPIDNCLNSLQSVEKFDEIIYTAPDGERLTQSLANELSLKKRICILCGHYKGVDERVREHLVTREISIGDYVLSGGELASAVIADSLARLIPGVLNDEQSALSDSFQDNLISPPVYSRPADYKGWKVPEVLLSGHQAKIEEWKFAQALQRTKERRPELLEDR